MLNRIATAMVMVLYRLWKVNNDTCADQVYNAIKTGYRLFDGACGMSQRFFFQRSPITASFDV